MVFDDSGSVLVTAERRKARRRRTAVTQQAVERTLGKLLTDENFRERFFASPEMATWEAGMSLSAIELEALSRLSRKALARFSEYLDRRISRASLQPRQGEAV
jgi:hypothetical protein